MQESIVFISARVQCRRKEGSRSLSHLLMSFLSGYLPTAAARGTAPCLGHLVEQLHALLMQAIGLRLAN